MPSIVFTSYARANWDPHLELFVDSLREEVRLHLPKIKREDILFIDQQDIDHGERWEQSLANELSLCKVCVAICTPHFVLSNECGKEVRAFLDRLQAWERSRPGVSSARRPFFPIIWMVPRPMPRALARFQYSEGELDEISRSKGLRSIFALSRYADQRTEFLMTLADRIRESVELVELPDGNPTSINYARVVSAFVETPAPGTFLLIPLMRSDRRAAPYGDARTWDIIVHTACEGTAWQWLDDDRDLAQAVTRAYEGKVVPIVLTDLETVVDPSQRPQMSAVIDALRAPSAVIVARPPRMGRSPTTESQADLTLQTLFQPALDRLVSVDWQSATSSSRLQSAVTGTTIDLLTAVRASKIPATAHSDDLANKSAEAGVPTSYPKPPGPGEDEE